MRPASYRGYGLSQGRPNEAGLTQDAQAALAALRARTDVDASRIVLFGRSLGGAVALRLAVDHQDAIQGLILENTFTSVEDMVSRVVPPLGSLIGTGRPLNFLVTNKWYNIKQVAKLRRPPLLMLTSLLDEMVPPRQMRQLHAAAERVNAAVTWVDFPTAHHMDAFIAEPERYWFSLIKFLDEHARSGGGAARRDADGAADDRNHFAYSSDPPPLTRRPVAAGTAPKSEL